MLCPERSESMNPIDYVIIAVILAIVGGAGFVIYKAKKSGKKCIGCPDSAGCSGCCSACSGCCSKKEE